MEPKQLYFFDLHQKLADKYNLSPHAISIIRSFSLGYKQSRKKIAEWCVKKLQPYLDHKNKPPYYLQPLLNFTASCSTEAWNDITQITEFDKGAEKPPAVSSK